MRGTCYSSCHMTELINKLWNFSGCLCIEQLSQQSNYMQSEEVSRKVLWLSFAGCGGGSHNKSSTLNVIPQIYSSHVDRTCVTVAHNF
jgi:hypothetical protein